MLRSLAVFLALALAGVAAALGWLTQPLSLQLSEGNPVVDLQVPPGASAQRVARDVVSAGVDTSAWMLVGLFRLSGQAHLIQAGSYEIAPGTTPHRLLAKLVNGERAVRSVALIEGWTFAQVRQALSKAEHLSHSGNALDDKNIMKILGKPGVHPEGRFFPDTYVYAKNSSDLDVLRQAANAMDKKLAEAWALRQPGVPLKSPDEALILASIIEKETGREADRALVAGVFANRLRIGMRLQTDPTVSYGVVDAGLPFDGRLRRVHLNTDTPYNTYTRAGLPPTPIAMPGWASLRAAVLPATTQAMYFVARGDGSSQFSATLDAHNQAVRRYILKQP